MESITRLSEQLREDGSGVEPFRNYFIQLKHGGSYYETDQSQFEINAYSANAVFRYGSQILLVSCRIYEGYIRKDNAV